MGIKYKMKDEVLSINLASATVKRAQYNLDRHGLSVPAFLQLMLSLAAEDNIKLEHVLNEENDLAKWLQSLNAD